MATKKSVAPKAPAKAVKPIAVVAEFKLDLALNATAAQVGKAIDSIKARGAKLDISIHSAACAILTHAESGDNTLANRLLHAMPKSARRNALATWFVAHGKLSEQTDETKKEAQPLMFDKAKATKLTDAQAQPFWAFSKAREGTATVEFDDYIGSVIKRLEKLCKVGGADGERARVTLLAISGVSQALHVKPEATPLAEGETVPMRRVSDHEAPAAVQ